MLDNELLSYIAGFLDGDGCIMFQLIRRKDYVYGYQIRASIVFYQRNDHRNHLEWLKEVFQIGYVRTRNDGMAEYTIVGIAPVISILRQLKPFVRLKKQHIELALKIAQRLARYKRFDKKVLLEVSHFIDEFSTLNYSKRRRNTTAQLQQFLAITPRND